MHHPARLAAILSLAATLAVPTLALSAAPVKTPWIDGTHIVAEAFKAQIERLATAGPVVPAARRAHTLGIRPGETATFWAVNVQTRQPYQLEAVLRKIGKNCYIYAEKGYDLADDVADRLAQQFDDVIYPTDRSWFGSEPTPGIDGDERITLLLLDIQDGWQPGQGYVAGYFFPLNGYSSRLFPFSNEREMFYLDVHPGDPTRADYLGVLAHEFEHMIHWNYDKKETRWLNEALAQLAFHVCGYGHAPQSFQYLKNTDVNMEDFQNTLENYGASYLWTYYLYGHYAGSSITERQAFFKDLVASSSVGMASIGELLAARGAAADVQSVFADWATANAASDPSIEGGRFGYDEGLTLGVTNEKQTYDLAALPEGTLEEKVQPWAADYIVYAGDTSFSPRHPTMIDKVKITSKEPASAVWNVNDGQLPPPRLIPQGSATSDGDRTVTTPLALQANGIYQIEIGPYARLGTLVQRLNFRLRREEGSEGAARSVAIFALPNLTEAGTMARGDRSGGALEFTFAGDKKKKFVVRAVVRRASGTTVSDVPLDDRNRGRHVVADADGADELTMVVVGLSDGKNEYKYGARRVATGATARTLVERGLRLAALRARADSLAADGPADEALGRFGAATERALASVTSRLAGLVSAGDSEALAVRAEAQAAAARGEARAMAVGDLLAAGDRASRFGSLHAGIAGRAAGTVGLIAPIHGRPRGNDEDDSHDNLRYVLFKNKELTHSLSHLKIDPQFLEGQIIQLWRLLEIVRGFPHLPIPDGFAFVDYDVQAAMGLLEGWAQEFGIEVPPVGTVRSPTFARETEVKEVAKRLLLAHNLVEAAYDNGLILGQDLSMTLYYFVRFILGAKSSVESIARHFTRIPIIGPIADKVKKLIIGKLMRVIDDLAWAIGTRLKPPYNAIVPMAVQLIVNAIARSMDVTVDPSAWPGWTKEMAIGLFGKYVLTSVPRIGYTARGQRAVDIAGELATAMTAAGTFREAYAAVWDDGSDDTATSMREKILGEITRRHKTAMTEHHIAWITGKLSEIARLAALIDPTAISKVATIVLTVATAGLFAHAGYTTASYFFALPRGDAIEGVRKAFDPTAQAGGETAGIVRQAAPDRKALTLLERDLGDAVAELMDAAQDLAKADGVAEAKGRWQRLFTADARVDDLSAQADGTIMAAAAGEPRTLSDEALETFYSRAQEFTLRRAKLLSDLLARWLDKSATVPIASEHAPSFDAYLQAVRSGLDTVRTSSSVATPLIVTEARAVVNGSQALIEAEVRNAGPQPLTGVRVRLMSGLSFEAPDGTAVWVGSLRAGERRPVMFRIRLTETKPLPYPTVSIVPEADGVVPLARTVMVE